MKELQVGLAYFYSTCNYNYYLYLTWDRSGNTSSGLCPGLSFKIFDNLDVCLAHPQFLPTTLSFDLS